MKKIVTFILLSLFTTFAFAQNTVTGSVKDAVTGEPLIGVGVIVSTGGGTVTDVDGSFSVNAGKDATLTFNLLGYADVTEPVNGRNKMDVFMKEDINFLDDRQKWAFILKNLPDSHQSLFLLRHLQRVVHLHGHHGSEIQLTIYNSWLSQAAKPSG